MTNTPDDDRWIERGILELEFYANKKEPLVKPEVTEQGMTGKQFIEAVGHAYDCLCELCWQLQAHPPLYPDEPMCLFCGKGISNHRLVNGGAECPGAGVM